MIFILTEGVVYLLKWIELQCSKARDEHWIKNLSYLFFLSVVCLSDFRGSVAEFRDDETGLEFCGCCIPFLRSTSDRRRFF